MWTGINMKIGRKKVKYNCVNDKYMLYFIVQKTHVR